MVAHVDLEYDSKNCDLEEQAVGSEGEREVKEEKKEETVYEEIIREQLICGICLEDLSMSSGEISTQEKKFGLLSGCNHIFCIECIKSWRSHAIHNQISHSERDSRLCCPVCRTFTKQVVPSSEFPVNDTRKKEIIDEWNTAIAIEVRQEIEEYDRRTHKHCVAFIVMLGMVYLTYSLLPNE